LQLTSKTTTEPASSFTKRARFSRCIARACTSVTPTHVKVAGEAIAEQRVDDLRGKRGFEGSEAVRKLVPLEAVSNGLQRDPALLGRARGGRRVRRSAQTSVSSR